VVAVPRDRFCPPGIYGRKIDTLFKGQRAKQEALTILFLARSLVLHPCTTAAAAPALFQSFACRHRGRFVARGGFSWLGWSGVGGGWSLLRLMVWMVSTDGALLASADLCLPVPTIISADRRNRILSQGAGGGKAKATRTFGDVDFHLCGQQ